MRALERAGKSRTRRRARERYTTNLYLDYCKLTHSRANRDRLDALDALDARASLAMFRRAAAASRHREHIGLGTMSLGRVRRASRGGAAETRAEAAVLETGSAFEPATASSLAASSASSASSPAAFASRNASR